MTDARLAAPGGRHRMLLTIACVAASATIWAPAATAQDGGDPCATDPTACPAPAAAFGKVDVEGPKRAKRGTVVTFRVTLRNVGDVPAEQIRVAASKAGTGSTTLAQLGAGQERTLKLRVTVARRTGKRTLEVTITGDGGLRTVAKTTLEVTKPAKKRKRAPSGVIELPTAPQLPIVNGG